jgi:hypothetical protein
VTFKYHMHIFRGILYQPTKSGTHVCKVIRQERGLRASKVTPLTLWGNGVTLRYGTEINNAPILRPHSTHRRILLIWRLGGWIWF